MRSRGSLVGYANQRVRECELTWSTVLGLNGQVSAQRLARLLLADPLGAEEQWEKELLKAGASGERAVLLK
jgi:hypothetical protein